ncbi:MAG: amidohydrolase family protein [Desulfatiglans sp.]|jgi:predicted TIM-barrel fold metal-dependent hydrolase|nr:amidohydrolase family protein [Thermodesulfobacteriota bacterium]MEE4352058.1 amidohydrolase family protein [Desulfatiglans sp.]
MIIDFHTHLFPPSFRNRRSALFADESAFQSMYDSPQARLAGGEETIRTMDEEGVQVSVIFGFPWEREDNYQRHNDYILEQVHRYPGRFVGFCCFSPLSPQGPREAERCLQSGLSGVGELAVYDSGLTLEVREGLKEVMAICAEFDAPVLIHTNEPVGHMYAGKTAMNLRQIYAFVKRYPSNRIILAHWGGGIFFYGLMKKEVKDVLKNVWYDTAASPYLYTPDIYRVAGEIIGFDKILFGSDHPLLRPQRYFREIDQAGLSQNLVDQIRGENAARLLRMSG